MATGRDPHGDVNEERSSLVLKLSLSKYHKASFKPRRWRKGGVSRCFALRGQTTLVARVTSRRSKTGKYPNQPGQSRCAESQLPASFGEYTMPSMQTNVPLRTPPATCNLPRIKQALFHAEPQVKLLLNARHTSYLLVAEKIWLVAKSLKLPGYDWVVRVVVQISPGTRISSNGA